MQVFYMQENHFIFHLFNWCNFQRSKGMLSLTPPFDEFYTFTFYDYGLSFQFFLFSLIFLQNWHILYQTLFWPYVSNIDVFIFILSCAILYTIYVIQSNVLCKRIWNKLYSFFQWHFMFIYQKKIALCRHILKAANIIFYLNS